MPGANTLAHYENLLITIEKSLIKLGSDILLTTLNFHHNLQIGPKARVLVPGQTFEPSAM
jgi:hypothetical protein